MNGFSQRILWGVITAMFLMIMALIGTAWKDVNSDIEKLQVTSTKIQTEYYRIGILEAEMKRLSRQVEILDSKIDRLLFDQE